MKNPNDIVVEQEWEVYWGAQGKPTSKVYDVIAEFYRKNIIIKILNHFIKMHFAKGAKVLHAGSGSGQVDTEVASYLNLTALDISPKALDIYRKVNPNVHSVIKGSIFELPFKDREFDGIYNLGVMEHFTPEEIHQILLEFKRVVKPGGKMVLFWPPTKGLSVNFLDSVHFVLNKILRKNIKLHPDEITRIKSKNHANQMVESAGLQLTGFYFGPMDLFTQAVLTITV